MSKSAAVPESKSRTRTVSWADPMIGASMVQKGMSGIEFLQKIVTGEIPPPPIAQLMGFSLTKVEPGYALFECDPAEYHYNPIGVVHGGLSCTLLDSTMSCAIQTLVPGGSAYTTLELKVHLVRGITDKTGHLRAEGRIIHSGSRVGTAEGKLIDKDGKIYAHGTTTCMIMKL
ncbi:MAG TPA: PaaI family thioesterase [Xanthobacteraceae bacterium]|nr:PaaI family thioesterase [Xanthobacteraceae bacterium]